MRKIIGLFLLTQVNLGITFAQSGAVMELSDSTIQLGNVLEGDTITSEITIINTGNETLTITDIQANCSCLLTELDESTILPQASTNLRISFNTTGKMGEQQKIVTILVNGNIRERRIFINADVTPSN